MPKDGINGPASGRSTNISIRNFGLYNVKGAEFRGGKMKRVQIVKHTTHDEEVFERAFVSKRCTSSPKDFRSCEGVGGHTSSCTLLYF